VNVDLTEEGAWGRSVLCCAAQPPVRCRYAVARMALWSCALECGAGVSSVWRAEDRCAVCWSCVSGVWDHVLLGCRRDVCFAPCRVHVLLSCARGLFHV
jgi:hypothetical protein